MLKKEIRKYLDSIGAFWSNVTGGTFSKIGDPDIVVCYNGRYYAIEAKMYGGVQSEWQKRRQKQIEEAGGKYILAHSVEEVEEGLNVTHEKKR